MKKFAVLFSLGMLVLTITGQALAAEVDSFNSDRKIPRLWAQIPFIQAGNLGQYQSTMAQGRDGTRRQLWRELMNEVQNLAAQGAMVEKMIEPMAKILLDFNKIYDENKKVDSVGIDLALESQFKGQFDSLYRQWDVRAHQRKVQFAEGAIRQGIDNNIKQLQAPNKAQAAQDIYGVLDYVAYGTFSSLGGGQFQLSLHISSLKNGNQRSFESTGRLNEALAGLAQQFFDFFQKNDYPAWQTPYKALTWMAMPINTGKQSYSFPEAQQYCQQQGYRLPYARELIAAAAGTQYQPGGIFSLRNFENYAVADVREVRGGHWLTMGNETATGGPINSFADSKGSFWCVKGKASSQILFVEQLWTLIRAHRSTNLEAFQALETIRFEISDFGAKKEFFVGAQPRLVQTYESIEMAQEVLKKNGIKLSIPKDLLR